MVKWTPSSLRIYWGRHFTLAKKRHFTIVHSRTFYQFQFFILKDILPNVDTLPDMEGDTLQVCFTLQSKMWHLSNFLSRHFIKPKFHGKMSPGKVSNMVKCGPPIFRQKKPVFHKNTSFSRKVWVNCNNAAEN